MASRKDRGTDKDREQDKSEPIHLTIVEFAPRSCEIEMRMQSLPDSSLHKDLKLHHSTRATKNAYLAPESLEQATSMGEKQPCNFILHDQDR